MLDNSGSTSDLADQTDRLVKRLRRQTGGVRWAASWLIPPFGFFYGALVVLFRVFIKGVGQDKRKRKEKGSKKVDSEDPNEIELRSLSRNPEADLDVLEPAGR